MTFKQRVWRVSEVGQGRPLLRVFLLPWASLLLQTEVDRRCIQSIEDPMRERGSAPLRHNGRTGEPTIGRGGYALWGAGPIR